MPGKILDTQIQYRGAIPDDLSLTGVRGKTVAWYPPYEAREQETKETLTNNQLLAQILKNADIDILLRTLGNAFFPRAITIGTIPTLIAEPNRLPKGYIFINANTAISGGVSNVTAFAAGTVFPVGTTNSASINVTGHLGATIFFNITASAGTAEVNIQSQDPLSGNWVTVQSDIYGGASAIGTYHGFIGPFGVDSALRVQVVVVGGAITGSMAVILKPSVATSVAGSAIFLGNEDVNTTIGFPLLSGQRETLYLKENTPLYGIAVGPTTLNLFELQ